MCTCVCTHAHAPPHNLASTVIIQTNPLTDPSCCSLNAVQSVFWAQNSSTKTQIKNPLRLLTFRLRLQFSNSVQGIQLSRPRGRARSLRLLLLAVLMALICVQYLQHAGVNVQFSVMRNTRSEIYKILILFLFVYNMSKCLIYKQCIYSYLICFIGF